MFVIRPIRPKDLDPLMKLAGRAGFGLTTLLPEREFLERRIRLSTRAFDERAREPAGQSFLFILEDLDSGRVVGTSGIVSKTGGYEPFYTYRIRREHFESETLGVSCTVNVLHLTAEHSGPAEIGSLFLDPDLQSRGLGGLLSRSRFLFMAERPELFEATVVAELRGVIDDQGRSPFWEAVGIHFFGMEFPRADYMSVKNKKFIADLMPRHPIYVPLLPEPAQAVIGCEHEHTRPARRMLEAEGFRFDGHVDIFEAGPVMTCKRDRIRTLRASQRATVGGIAPDASALPALIANTRMDFRACLGPIGETGNGEVQIDAATAAALEIGTGDTVRYLARNR